ncbi:MAG: hypothetical protein QNL12_08305 [Acidimicrobiia bacterium]|nr:hypothetical protein [Acidimicrobiia bacterium]MDX2467301.1 hypothetical protein [Acidimicrobiia bacterium]
MRLALHQSGEVATRAGRILLAERTLTAIGLIDKHPTERDDRLEHVEVLATYDALVTDAEDPTPQIEAALTAEIDCVVWGDADGAQQQYGDAFSTAGLRLLTGCNLGSGIAPSLTAHEVADAGTVLDVTTAWTEPGTPRRRGIAIPFPEPIGSRWAEAKDTAYTDRAYVARVGGEWAGAMARVTAATGSGVVTRIVGVADLAVHLEALALATGAMLVSSYPVGISQPADLADEYLSRALNAGLDVAAHTHHGS